MKEVLIAFYEVIEANVNFGSNHISVYFALLHRAGFMFTHDISFYRAEILHIARVSRRTYNRCMRDLQKAGLLEYRPTNDGRIRSTVFLRRL